jgi:hypothetical protein
MSVEQVMNPSNGAAATPSDEEPILELTNVKKHFNIGGGMLRGRPQVNHAHDDDS